MRIALISYTVSPFRGSEFSVAWNYITRMSKEHELYVIYGSSGDKTLEDFGNTSEMKAWLAEDEVKNVHFIDVPIIHSRWIDFNISLFKYNDVLPYYFVYQHWQKQAYRKVQELVAEGQIDLIHYLNPIGFKEPGFCWKIKNVPYVWGPIKGAEGYPFALQKALSVKGKINVLTRKIVHNATFFFSPRVRKAFFRANAIFAATPQTQIDLKRYYHRDTICLPENGIQQMCVNLPIKWNGTDRLELIWVGRLVEGKALSILIDALSITTHKNFRLTVLGDGPLMGKLKSQVQDCGLSENVSFMGNLPRESVMESFSKSHLNIISSLSEATSTVLFEAMSCAVPTITLDHCGMSGVVCEKCGIKIPIRSYNQVTTDMAKAIEDILIHPEKIEQLSKGVLECSKDFMWENRAKVFNDTYNKLLKK